MRVFVPAVMFGVNLRRIRHECCRVLRVRLREQSVMRALRVIAKVVPLRRELVKVGGRAVVFGSPQVRLSGRMARHYTSSRYPWVLALHAVLAMPCGSSVTNRN